MALFDMPLERLREYRPAIEEPDDFDAFWQSTLADARRHALEARFDLSLTAAGLLSAVLSLPVHVDRQL